MGIIVHEKRVAATHSIPLPDDPSDGDALVYNDTTKQWEPAGAVPPSAHTHPGEDVTSAVANATDADTVDGMHASDLAEAEHTHALTDLDVTGEDGSHLLWTVIDKEVTNVYVGALVTQTPTENAVPVAGEGGYLDPDWITGYSADDHNHDEDYVPYNDVIDVPTTITVGLSECDFTTVQAAWESLANKVILADVTIDVQNTGGMGLTTTTLAAHPYGNRITIQGDTRFDECGLQFQLISAFVAGGGMGDECTVTVSGMPNVGVEVGDRVYISGKPTSSANLGLYDITAVDVMAGTVTYSNPSAVSEPVVAGYVYLWFLPNVVFNNAVDTIGSAGESVKIHGFRFAGDQNRFGGVRNWYPVTGTGEHTLALSNCAITKGKQGIVLTGTALTCTGQVAVLGHSEYGVLMTNTQYSEIENLYLYNDYTGLAVSGSKVTVGDHFYVIDAPNVGVWLLLGAYVRVLSGAQTTLAYCTYAVQLDGASILMNEEDGFAMEHCDESYILGELSQCLVMDSDTINENAFDANTLNGNTSDAFAASDHDHDSDYAAIGHDHDSDYAALAHDHDSDYAALAHDHDSDYAAIGHDHDSDYAAIGHDHDSDYAALAHDHDSDYAALAHDHNGTYCRWRGSSTGAPATPLAGDIYIELGDSKTYIYNGATWDALN